MPEQAENSYLESCEWVFPCIKSYAVTVILLYVKK